MKRFSVEEDREFEIAGEVFKWVYPYWEDIADVFDKDSQDVEGNGAGEFTVRATIKDFIDRIQLFLESGDRPRWVELTKRKKDPVPHSQYAALYQWLLEVTSGTHPTEPSSPSEDGQPPTAATSTAGSS